MLGVIAYIVWFLIGWSVAYAVNHYGFGPIHPSINVLIGVITGTVATTAYWLVDKWYNNHGN